MRVCNGRGISDATVELPVDRAAAQPARVSLSTPSALGREDYRGSYQNGRSYADGHRMGYCPICAIAHPPRGAGFRGSPRNLYPVTG